MNTDRNEQVTPAPSWRDRIQERIPWVHSSPRRVARKADPGVGVAGTAYGAAGWVGWPRSDRYH